MDEVLHYDLSEVNTGEVLHYVSRTGVSKSFSVVEFLERRKHWLQIEYLFNFVKYERNSKDVGAYVSGDGAKWKSYLKENLTNFIQPYPRSRCRRCQ